MRSTSERSGPGDEGARTETGREPTEGGQTLETGERLNGDDVRRGRAAEGPEELTKAAWKDVLWRLVREVKKDHVDVIAAAVAFAAMLSIFPMLIAAVSVYGLFVSPEEARAQIETLSGILPHEARVVLADQLETIVGGASTTLGSGALFGLLVTLWTASNGTAMMMQAIGIAYDERDERSFVAQRALALGLTVGFLLVGILAFAAIAVAPGVMEFIGLGEGIRDLVMLGRWPVLAVLAMFGLSVLYRVAPHRHRARWRWVSWGAVLATLLWVGGSYVFSFFVSTFGRFGETYGALAGVIVLMLWLYLSAFVILLGAELNAEMEAQTAKDSTTGEPQPMGRRGARKADVLGDPRPSGGRSGPDHTSAERARPST